MPARDDRAASPTPVEVVIDAVNSSPPEELLDPPPPTRFGQPRLWQLGRTEYLAGAAILLVAVVVAYLLGSHQSHSDGPSTSASTSPRPSATDLVRSGPAIAQVDGLCATQLGAQLQLGTEITNTSSDPVTLMGLDAVLPLGGLRATKTLVGTCGQIQVTRAVGGTVLAPGASIWISITFDVLITCPSPLPVQFNVMYAQASQAQSVTLGGFSDLGNVTYSGCDAPRAK